MRYSLNYGIGPHESLDKAVQLAQTAEEFGFECLWLLDSPLVSRDFFTVAALCAANTSRITIASGVTQPVTRHVSAVASSFSALKEVSQGRVTMGIGVGDSTVKAYGNRPATRRQLEDFISKFRGLVSGQRVRVDEREVYMATHAGDIPVFITAGGSKMAHLAAQIADGCLAIVPPQREAAEAYVARVHEALRAVGRPRDQFTIDMWLRVSVDADEKKAIGDMRGSVGASVLTEARAHGTYDFSEHLSPRATHARGVSDEVVKAGAIVGNPDRVAQTVRTLLDGLDVDRVTLTLSSRNRFERLRLLGQEVIPQIGLN